MWRTDGPCSERILSYVDDTTDVFIKGELLSLAIRGGQLIHQCGGVYPALQKFQGSEMRTHPAQMMFAHENRSLFPIQYPAVVGILDQGVRAVHDRG